MKPSGNSTRIRTGSILPSACLGERIGDEVLKLRWLLDLALISFGRFSMRVLLALRRHPNVREDIEGEPRRLA